MLDQIVTLGWIVMCITLMLCGIIAIYIYYKDVKWKHNEYLREYIDKMYDAVLIHKDVDE